VGCAGNGGILQKVWCVAVTRIPDSYGPPFTPALPVSQDDNQVYGTAFVGSLFSSHEVQVPIQLFLRRPPANGSSPLVQSRATREYYDQDNNSRRRL
jgi:hypothetical protein